MKNTKLKLKPKSKRNRHTGKINSAKAEILAYGSPFRFSDGTEYFRLAAFRGFSENPYSYTYVRKP